MRSLNRLAVLFVSVVLFTPLGESQNSAAPVMPPAPSRLLDIIHKENHPMLLANADRFREAKRSTRNELMNDRGEELRQRLVGFYNPQSKWYLGDGPLSERKDFHPAQLTELDFEFYTKVLLETMVYMGIEKERWTIDGLKREFVRLLNEIQPGNTTRETDVIESPLSERDVQLLALASLTYDLVYNRFDTIERHPYNNRLNQIRAKLAAECAASDPAAAPVAQRIERGSALGLATLLCISIAPSEWGKARGFSEQSFLPELYQAITYTASGVWEMEAQAPHIQIPLHQLETLLLIAIPWMESLKRFGYPYEIQQDFYTCLVDSLEIHRLPNKNDVLQPFVSSAFRDPWIPIANPIFGTIAESMYVKKKPGEATQTFIPFSAAGAIFNSATEKGSYAVPKPLSLEDINILHDGQKPMSLRESFERFGFPKKPTPIPMPAQKPVSNPDAGWAPPERLILPSAWGELYLLAERDNPTSSAGEVWEEQAVEIDSHACMFLYYKEFPVKQTKTERSSDLLQYPQIQTTLLAMNSPRENYLFASQAARSILVMPTYAVDCDSFVLSEGGHPWRWFHEIPSSVETVSAAPLLDASSIVVASAAVIGATPLETSLFTCWETYSPVGRTLVVRRHLGGIGSGYTAIAHFPSAAKNSQRVEYVQFSVPEQGDIVLNEETPDIYSIYPSTEELPDRPMNMETWQRERRQERMGEKKVTVTGVLKILFSPDSIQSASAFTGTLGKRLEAELVDPDSPFFYLCDQDMPGREMFQVKYGDVPMPGTRILEWKQGIEIIAIRVGDKIQNAFIESDADFAIVMRDSSMKGIFYLMVNGSYLRCKFAPSQKEFTFLADTMKKKETVAWCQRHLYSVAPPKNQSRFYAPEMVGFECPGYVVQYGQKANSGVVLDSKPAPQKRP